MRILVCGGRNYGHVVRTCANTADEPPETQERLMEYHLIQDTLNRLVNKVSVNYNPNDNWLPTDIIIIHGGATGADSAAGDFAAVNFCVEEIFQANWKRYGQRAGYVRNKKMLDQGRPDLVVAFPGGKGTAMMVKLAKTAGVRVIEMGSFGASSQTEAKTPPKFKTKKYEQMYIDRVREESGSVPSFVRASILNDLIKEEDKWLANMGAEYDEIMQAQELVDKADGIDAD